MKLVLASNNQGKLAELQALFAPLGIELVRQADLNIPEAPEPHRTFVENALAKARHAAQVSGLPALADDAGLCVEAFGGLPGVDTAFYATQFGYAKGDDNNVRALLEQMQGIQDRRAALVSTLVALRSADDPEPLVATGRAPGLITHAAHRRKRFRLRPGHVSAGLRQDLRRAAHRGEKRQQPPRPSSATDAGADARALVRAGTSQRTMSDGQPVSWPGGLPGRKRPNPRRPGTMCATGCAPARCSCKACRRSRSTSTCRGV